MYKNHPFQMVVSIQLLETTDKFEYDYCIEQQECYKYILKRILEKRKILGLVQDLDYIKFLLKSFISKKIKNY